MSVVLIRLDKIGDLISTLPCDLHSKLQEDPTHQVHWVIAKGLGALAQAAVPSRKFLEISLDPIEKKNSFFQLLRFLQATRPEAVVVFYAPWWVSLACWWARVPKRVSRASQWHSFLFFNRRLRQSRSRSEKHEAQYNQELLEFGLDFSHEELPPLRLQAKENRPLLKNLDLQSDQYVVVHPGMFGSALNWPEGHYNQLISNLIETTTVAITGTNQDEKFLSTIKARWQNENKVKILQGKLSLQELLSVLAGARCVIAPSTGVLHLAAALGTKSVGIYSPILAHHPRRWGPRGPQAQFLLPPVECPATQACLQEKCEEYPCMQKIEVAAVVKAATLQEAP